MKWIKTTLILSNIFCGIMLWVTREGWLESQSAFADSPNVIWYHAMHLTGAFTFILLGHTQKRILDYICAAGILGIVATNMYDVPILHNWTTAVTFCLILFNMLYNSSPRNLKYNLIIAPMAAIFFLLGLSPYLHLFLAESLVEGLIGVHLLRRTHIDKNA